MEVKDLSLVHELISGLFSWPKDEAGWNAYRLSPDQIEFFNQNGWLAGIPMIDSQQVDQLRTELTALIAGDHPGHSLFYEFHHNESPDPEKILFHCLGPGASARAFMMCCGIPGC